MAIETKQLAYTIDSRIIDELYKLRSKLLKSIRYRGKVAALCLLGEKDNVVDSFEPIISDKGCWDVPAVSSALFEKSFVKMIEKDRVIVGMAIVKPENHETSYISTDLEQNIRNMKTSFSDITKTVWLIIGRHAISTYRASFDDVKRLWVTESKENIFINTNDSQVLNIFNFLATKNKIDYRKVPMSFYREAKNYLNDIQAGKSRVTAFNGVVKSVEKILKEPEIKKPAKKKITTAKKVKTNDHYRFLKTKDGKEILWSV